MPTSAAHRRERQEQIARYLGTACPYCKEPLTLAEPLEYGRPLVGTGPMVVSHRDCRREMPLRGDAGVARGSRAW